MTTTETAIAAALTPPAAGGIAVVQIAGHDAPTIVGPLLKSRRPLNLQDFDPGGLRLARFVDRGEEIDDVIVTARREGSDVWVIDLSLHGGQRVVQRVLLALARAGARVVSGDELLNTAWPASNPVRREALRLLLNARTTAVAHWLLRTTERLRAAIEDLLTRLQAGQLQAVIETLSLWCGQEVQVRHLLHGVRVVLMGEPNVGKSTLANVLAGREGSIVSEVPGTTRDWIEHAGAVDGVPMTFVDTAGVRATQDPLESEAIRRSLGQTTSADVVVHVMDSSLPAPGWLQQTLLANAEHLSIAGGQRQIWVWNKGDLPLHADHVTLIRRAAGVGTVVSARSGERIDQVRAQLLASCGLADWQTGLSAPFAGPHVWAIREALTALQEEPPAVQRARTWLKSVIFAPPAPGRRRSDGL